MNSGLDIRISEDLDDPRWDEFLAVFPGGHHVQTGLWARVKAPQGWRPIRILARRDGRIVAGAQVLIRDYRFIGPFAYVTKGPVCGAEDPGLAARLIDEITRVGAERRCRVIAIQPPNDGHFMGPLLGERGYGPSALELASVASIQIDLSPGLEQILGRCKQKTRQYVHRARRLGVTIEEASAGDLDRFYDLHTATAKRQRFVPYSKSYYETMRDVLEPRGYFKLLMARLGGETVSGLLLVPFGRTVTTKIIGWAGLHREARPNHALYWGAIRWAKEHGFGLLDLEGVETAEARTALNGKPVATMISHSPFKIKFGFGGAAVIFPEAYDRMRGPVLGWAYRRLGPALVERPVVAHALERLQKR